MRARNHSRTKRCARSNSSRESGYALLMVIFLVASLMLFAAMASPNVLINGRREREQEIVWRGNQYVRAIRLYYQKNGKFPQTLEDLTKPDISGAHYLRKSYKDLSNSEDGTWRMIYVSPAGQLIGSVRYHTLQEMAAALGTGVQIGGLTLGTTAAAPQQTGFGQTPGQAAPTQAGQTSSFGLSTGFGSSTQPTSLTPLEPVTGPVFGGSLIGVGGKQKRPSLLYYHGGKRYYEWEFIFNPLAATGLTGQPGGAVPVTGAPGAVGAGTGAPTSPFSFSGISGTPNIPTTPTAPNNPTQPVTPTTPPQMPIQ